MYRVSKLFKFEAAHQLPEHDGKCKRMHGHSYKVQVVMAGSKLHMAGPKAGMLIDFDDLRRLVEPIIEKWDHVVLNDLHLGATSFNPTAEMLASYIASIIRDQTPPRVTLDLVRVWETETSYGEWHQ